MRIQYIKLLEHLYLSAKNKTNSMCSINATKIKLLKLKGLRLLIFSKLSA